MAIYYVGLGGSDAADGLSWANRFLTLNGAEDEPVAANDTVYVAPGVYRELLTCDVSGTSGNPITYIGDVTGENTDGVGGVVRVTGSDDDQSGTRAYCVSSTTKDYRTFRGFAFDMATAEQIYAITSCDNWIIEDCIFGANPDDSDGGLRLGPASGDFFTVQRCIFHGPGKGAYIIAGSDISVNSTSVIESCFFISAAGANGTGVYVWDVDGFTVKNCTFYGVDLGVRTTSLALDIDVNNCVFENCSFALRADATSELTEDYNSVPLSNATPRTNVNVGANSNTYPALLEMPMLLDGIQFPWNMLAPSKWSQLARIAGTGESTDDLYGQTRPTVSAKKSWGAVQYQPGTRETTTTRGSSAASIAFADAGRHQIFVPVTAVSTTISVYANREANYAGTNPQMIIKEPGQANRTTTDAAAVSQWNELTDTWTPSGDVDYVVVELASSNTATSGSYGTYFDDLSVT